MSSCPIHEGLEKWKTIPILNGWYEASNRGRIRSKTHTVRVPCRGGGTCLKTLNGRLLRGSKNKHGYIQIELAGGYRDTAHRLVLMAFRGPCPEGMEACHSPDNDRTHNCVENLRWGTPTDNNLDRIRHGTMMVGEDVNTSKLTPELVEEIKEAMSLPLAPGRQRRPRGFLQSLCRKYDITPTTLYVINSGKSWKHLR